MLPHARPLAALLVLVLVLAPRARAEEGQSTFDTPEAAAKALIDAAAKNDDAALKALWGPSAADLVQDGADPIVARDRAEFAQVAQEKMALERHDDGTVVIVVGENEWPLPVPLVQEGGRWRFDAASGREEILARRIGNNELDAIAICRGYVDAQVAYAAADRDGDEVREYAQRIVSTPGTKDGLYWATNPDSDEELSPLGPLVASLQQYVTEKSKDAPFNGYYWKVLTAQGSHAPGGAHSYVINGNMIAGFALVGVPARYMDTGVMTFLVSHHGKVLEKDLGENGLATVEAMTAYDPDDTWTEVSEEGE